MEKLKKLLKNLQFGTGEATGAKVAFITSKMGSIADNSSGGSYVYRSSKSALNCVVKSLSHDLRADNISVAAIHPGWVKTDMGGQAATLTPVESAQGIIQTVGKLDASNTGSFWNWNGTTHDW